MKLSKAFRAKCRDVAGGHVVRQRLLVVSIQKSGTHLLHRLLEQAGLRRVGVDQCQLQDFKGLRPDEFLWSHFCPHHSVQQALEQGSSPQVRIILLIRDPRDVLVSWFHWMHPKKGGAMHAHQLYMRKVYGAFSDEELMEIFITVDKFRNPEYNPLEQFRFCRSLYFHPGVLNVRFEDLVGPTGGGEEDRQIATVKNVLQYIGGDPAKAAEVSTRIFNTSSPTFRSGRIGGHREVLTGPQLKLFNQLHADVMRQYGYK